MKIVRIEKFKKSRVLLQTTKFSEKKIDVLVEKARNPKLLESGIVLVDLPLCEGGK